MTRPSIFTRRQFLASSSAAAAATTILSPANAFARRTTPATTTSPNILVPAGGRRAEADRHALAALAIEAGRAAGASYVDVRLSCRMLEEWSLPSPTYPMSRSELHGVGVRVLVNGYWGFMGSAVWTPDEMARLARGAVVQAKAFSLGQTRESALAPMPQVVKGEWIMPVKYDPFQVPYGEKYDFFNQTQGIVERYSPYTRGTMFGEFRRADTVFASSEGSSWAQTTYLTLGNYSLVHMDQPGFRKFNRGGAGYSELSPAGAGWEYFCEGDLFAKIPDMSEEAKQYRDRTNVDVGRYTLVCTARATAGLVNGSLGAATELDRAMGMEANAGGTSYLDQPLEMLGSYTVGSPLLNLHANRSHPGGAATVKWDDEGVAPDDFAIVKDGMLVDYQTTREQVSWISPYYEKMGMRKRSHGCAYAGSASQFPMQNSPNLQLMPGPKDESFDDLVATTGKGVALVNVTFVMMDQQQLNGLVYGDFREIVKGKLGRYLDGAGIQFRSPELWKSLSAVGGPSALRWYGMNSLKGQPTQTTPHSVGAVPVQFKNTAIIDSTRKA